MALPKMTRKTEFEIKTKALGTLVCPQSNFGTMGLLEKIDPTQEKTALINEMMKIALLKETEPYNLGDKDVQKITDSEREEFAEKFIKANPFYFNDKKITDEDGQRTVKSDPDKLKYEKKDGESWLDYLQRSIKLLAEDRRKKWANQFTQVQSTLDNHRKLFTPAFDDHLKSAIASASMLKDAIIQQNHMRDLFRQQDEANKIIRNISLRVPSKMPSLKLEAIRDSSPSDPYILPPNEPPDDRWDEVLEKLDSMQQIGGQMAGTVAEMSGMISQFVVDFGAFTDNAREDAVKAGKEALENQKNAIRSLKIAIWAIVIPCVLTVLQMGYTEFTKDRTSLNAVIQSIDKVAEGQDGLIEALKSSDKANSENVVQSIDNLNISLKEFEKAMREEKAEKQKSTPPDKKK